MSQKNIELVLHRGFIILDFGSQFTQLIARRLRELGFYSEIHSYDLAIESLIAKNPYGVILSGGPNSVYEKNSPQRDIQELKKHFPILGVCYGMQLIVHQLGGAVEPGLTREYGLNMLRWKKDLIGLGKLSQKVWMSHGDVVTKLPPDFELLAETEDHPAVIQASRCLAVQFHPEVAHTEEGEKILKYFAKMCEAKNDWQAPQILKELSDKIKTEVGENSVLMGLSGGVDSTVVATLLTQTLGREKVHCVFINNGLLRLGEYEQVLTDYENLGLNVYGVDATEKFLNELQGLTDPEKKRKTIGRVFIEVFEDFMEKNKNLNLKFLAQGTLYPDVIESVSSVGGSVTIKSHHNVGGLPEKMKLKLLEPVRLLFKDEVRKLGRELGIPEKLIQRHPFPGPGLSIRVIGEVTEEKLKILKKADDIFIKTLHEMGLYKNIWQAFCVLLPVQSVGVQGDSRSYDQVLALRAVTSVDGMTADWYPFEFKDMREISNRITNQVKGINRVVYDVTSKPPATIEWE